MSSNIADLRRDYQRESLDINQVSTDPFEQFELWWQDVLAADISEPNGMTLATATPDGKPSARIVLLKGYDRQGFAFYTNYDSRKGRELLANPYGALVWWWDALERQVRAEGTVHQLDPAESDAYFNSRPKASRLGAWTSKQSQVIRDRQVLERRHAQLEAQYAETEDIPRPEHWGGFRLVPESMEFWQGRSSRLHDRLRYSRHDNQWTLERLSP